MNRTRCLVILVLALAAGTLRASDEIDVFADFRVRLEQDFDSRDASGVDRSDRLRARVRARVGLRYTHDEHFSVGVRLRSGSDLSHQSPHITVVDFTGDDTGDSDFNLDQWYLKGKSGRFWSWVGRNVHPFWKQNEMLFDDDVTPAGIAVGWSRELDGGTLGLRGGYFSLPVGMQESSGNLGAVQAVYARSGWTVAAGLFDIEGRSDDPDAASLLNANGTRDYAIVQASAQFVMPWHDRPLSLGLDLLHNIEDYSPTDPDPFTAANHDATDGFVVQARWGGLRDPGQWLFGYAYARIESLAVHASYAQDDWVRWGSAVETRSTDLRGHELRVAHALSKGSNVVLRLYVAEAITSVEDGNRARIDLNCKF